MAATLLLVGCDEELPEALTEQAVGVDAEIGGRDAPPPEDGAEVDDEFSPEPGSYPDELPEEFPLLGGKELLESSVEEVDGATVVTVETAAESRFDEAALFYDTELPGEGWTVVDDVASPEDGAPNKRWEIEGFGWTGSVELRQQGDANDIGGTTVRLLVELREA